MAENGFAEGVVTGMATNDRGGYGYGYPMMPVMPYYGGFGGMGGYGGGYGFGGDWIWIIVLFALLGNGGFGGSFGGGMGAFPWLLASSNNTDNNVNAGFNQAATAASLAGIQNSITTGFSNAEVASCNRAIDNLQTAYQNQIASMNQNFAMQQAFDNCCCENRLGLANLNSTILSENCADRAAVTDGVRDILANQTANTQRILDQLCNDKIDAKNEKIADLERQITMANLAASQTAQTAALIADNNAQTRDLITRIAPYPIPAYEVGNPYGYRNGCNCDNNRGFGNGYGFNGFNGTFGI